LTLKKNNALRGVVFAIWLFFDVFVGMLAEGIAWRRFLGLGIVAYIAFGAFGFADFFFVGSFTAFKSVCGEVERFENGDECGNACVPNAHSDRS